MNREFFPNILLLLLVLLFLAYVVPITITGFGLVNEISLSIKPAIKGEVTAFVYDSFISLNPFETQEIFVEFTNTGTEDYDAQIEEYIYFYVDGRMEEKAHYYDSIVHLYPGYKRPFRITYSTIDVGTYYIKVKASYGVRRTETWGSFYVGYIIPNNTPGPPGPSGPGTGGGSYTPPMIEYIPAQPLLMSLEYDDNVTLYPGRSTLTNIRVKNVGNDTLHEVRFYFSAANLLDIDVNPKEIYYLDVNESLMFLLDIYAPPTIPITSYPIDFEVVTREIKESGTIRVDVMPYNITLEEEVRKTIQNYDYLITELEREILEASIRGVDTSTAEESLENAKMNLDAARKYYELQSFEKAKDKLDETKDDLKECVFNLAHSSFAIFAPAFSPFWILLVVILMAILFFFIQKRRKKEKKPKLLRASEEAET
jgi:hypothetical protein